MTSHIDFLTWLQHCSRRLLKDVVQKAEDMEVGSDSSETDDELEGIVTEKPKHQWDCESIISKSRNHDGVTVPFLCVPGDQA